MKDNLKLNIALILFLVISIIILPTIIGRGGIDNKSVNNQEIPNYIYKFTTDLLNMRTGPGIEFEKIITIPRGHKVQVLEEENDWSKIIYQGKTGYSSSKYLSDKLGEELLEDN